MSKQLIVITAVLVLAFASAGCSSAASSAGDSVASASVSASASGDPTISAATTSSGSSLFTSDEWPQSKATEGVPAPKFNVGIEPLSTSDNSINASWKGVQENEAAAYAEEIKQAGFTYDANETKSTDMYSYTAHNNENHPAGSFLILTYSSDGRLSLSVSNHAA